MSERFDVLIAGGGINGTAIARDAAGRGLKVCLVEADDLAEHTSSASSKLIHGGLRYLEQYEFSLVSEALIEREVLYRTAPHIIRPLRFALPHEPHLRPAWEIRIGLFLYDHLDRGKRTLPGSRRVRFDKHPSGEPLQPNYRTGFVYSDTQVQDSRLVVLYALDAVAHGARVQTRVRMTHARRAANGWTAELAHADGHTETVEAGVLVNAAGPWATDFLDHVAKVEHQHALRLVKGSHIVVPRLYAHDYAYTFQLPDRRIIFAIPYEGDYTLIGTTDMEYHDDPSKPVIAEEETAYLIKAVNRYFKRPVSASDVVWSYAGVRPLVEDKEASAQEVTRGYRLELDTRGAPLLSVFGGKITTSRHLAEDAMAKLAHVMPHFGGSWTANHALPGGERRDLDAYADELHTARPWLPKALLDRLVHSYGTHTDAILAGCHGMADLGEHFGATLYAAEVNHLVRHEWALTAEDILWRRSKLGLRVKPKDVERLEAYLEKMT